MNFFFHELLMREKPREVGEVLVMPNRRSTWMLCTSISLPDGVPLVNSGERNSYAHIARVRFLDVSREPLRGRHPQPSLPSSWYELVSYTTRGFVRQETIPIETFLGTPTGRLYLG
jgi:hypothetical protein